MAQQLATIEVYANDTKPYLEVTLDDGDTVNPTPIDLTEVDKVIFKIAAGFRATSLKAKGYCTIVGDPAAGKVRYQFESGDLSSGGWIGEITLLYNDGRVQTMGHFKLKVLPDLPGDDT